MKLSGQFCSEQNEKPETFYPEKLDQLFGNFIAVVKKENDENYEPSSIRGFLSSLERHLRSKGYPHTINKNPMFPHINKSMKAKLTFLKSQGHGSKPNEAE